MKNRVTTKTFNLKLLYTSIFLIIIGLFFISSLKVYGDSSEIEVKFYTDEFNYYVVNYEIDDEILEVFIDDYYIFTGWYDSLSFTGENYYGSIVSEETPKELYALTYYKNSELDDYILTSYLDGYEIEEYTGDDIYLNIPSFYYEETEVEGLYEVTNILSIGSNAFINNSDILNISIPESIINIEDNVFNNLTNLMSFYVSLDNLYYSHDSFGVLFDKDLTEIIHFPVNLVDTIYKTPETLIILKEDSIKNTNNIEKLIINSNATLIETNAIINNNSLKTIVVSEGNLETINDYAFTNNTSLELVSIPSNVIYVGKDVFNGSNNLLNVYYEDELINIPSTWDNDWDLSVNNIIEDYNNVSFTVTYLDDEDEYIYEEEVYFNQDAIGFTPVKDSNAEFDFYFSYWEGERLTNITSDITVKAVFYGMTRSYTIRFFDANDELYGIKEFYYGTNEDNNYWFTDVFKAPDAQYTYVFSHWSVDLTFIDRDVDVYPVFDEILNNYNVIFYSHDDESYFDYNYLPYGSYIEEPLTVPLKQRTEKYEYTFSGWYLDKERTIPFNSLNLTGNLFVYPKFTESLRSFNVDFYNGSVLYERQTIIYGSSALTPNDPLKDSTAKYRYEFSGWSVDYSNITSYLRVDALYDEILRDYTVNFYNGEVLVNSQQVCYGSSAVLPDNPTKEETKEYTYSFNGWDKDITNITKDLDVYATYNNIAKEYEVFYETNGGSIISSHNQIYNTYISEPTKPTKVGYSFDGWYKEAELINPFNFNVERMPANNITLYAKWNLKSYTVILYETEEGITPKVIFRTLTINHGSNIELNNLPHKQQTNMYVYEFLSWSESLNDIKEDKEIYPVFKESLREYTVNFYNGEVLIHTEKVHYLEGAVAPEDPVKEGTEKYTYVFSGWDTDYTSITKNINVYALYDEIINTFSVKFYNEDLTLIVERIVNYGSSAVAPVNPVKEKTIEHEFIFSGWDKDFTNITKDLNVYATYNSIARKYLVRFYNEDVLIKEENIEYNEQATAPNDPVKQSTNEYSYIFSGWDKDFMNITSDLDIYALYDEVLNTFTISFNSNGGSLVESISYDYTEKINNLPEPEKLGYSFTGWYLDINLSNPFILEYMPSYNITLYAKWSLDTYTITYLNLEGVSNLNRTTYNVLTEDFSLTNLNNRTAYIFKGFYDDLTEGSLVTEIKKGTTGNIVLYARWELRVFTVNFYDYNNNLLKTLEVGYGLSATSPSPQERVGYTFISYDKSFSNVTSNLEVYPIYEINSYSVNFISEGIVVNNIESNYNTLINEPSEPLRVGYSFVGWYKEEALNNLWDFNNDLLIEDINLYAKYSINSYTISFNSNGGDLVDSLTYLYNEEIDELIEPEKLGYSFVGWYLNSSLTNIFNLEYMPANNLTLYAKWEINSYIVKFYNDDLSYLGEVLVNHGSNASFTIPVKDSTEQYNYVFKNWDKSINNITSDLDVYALYEEVLRSYQITFYSKESTSEDNAILKTSYLVYGSLIEAPMPPVKESSKQYIYTFSSWDKEFNLVNGTLNIYPIFSSSLRKYTVKFYDDDLTTLLKEEEVYYNQGATAPTEPVKASTERDDFTFAGWDKDFNNITGNLNVYATYNITVRKYVVNFYNEDVLIKSTVVEYGRSAVAPANPKKTQTAEFNYEFIGWDKEFNFITESIDVNALYSSSIRKYTVYFFDDNRGTLLGSTIVEYGKEATASFTPEKASNEQYDYTFTGWDKDLSFITESIQVYAIYESHIRSYTVTFYNDIGTVILKTETVTYGSAATAPIAPIKESTEQYNYNFVGWNLDYTFVDGNMKVYAMYESILNEYVVSFYNEEVLYKEVYVEYGNSVSLPLTPTKENSNIYEYTFSGWYVDELFEVLYDVNEAVIKDISLYAKFTENYRSFNVKFYNEGKLFNEQTVTYGNDAVMNNIPTKERTVYYEYVFNGWDKDFTNIKNDLIIEATYLEVLREYNVYFYDGNTLLKTLTTTAGSGVSINDPVKESTDKYHYAFIGWDKEFSNVTSDLTVYALFEEELREYTVYFYNSLNEVIKEDIVSYGFSAKAPEVPVKEDVEKYYYVFKNWSIGFSNVYSDLHVHPIYEEVIKTFTVNFYNGEEIVKTRTVNYGSSVSAPEDPIKESTEKYNYIFNGWSDEAVYVVSDLNINAIFIEVIKTFTVIFYDYDAITVLKEEVVEYGSIVNPPKDPEREDTYQHSYTFKGWSNDNYLNVVNNLHIYALYSESLRVFTVNFYINDILVETKTVIYGGNIEINLTPEKEDEGKYSYTFTGWSKSLSFITEDLEVHAVFKETEKTYTVTFYDDTGIRVLKRETVVYGNNGNAPLNVIKDPSDKYTYEFIGWNKEFTNIKEDTDVYAVFEESLRVFTVRFYNGDVLIKEEEVTYGFSANAPEEPIKDKTEMYSYIFSNWSLDFNDVKTDLNIYAVYEEVINEFKITYYDSNNNIYKEEMLTYGKEIVPASGPSKESDKYNDYTFIGWEGYINGMTISGDISFTPLYEEEEILYSIIIIANRREYKFNLPYLSSFPDVNSFISDTNKYTYIGTEALTNKGEVISIPEKVTESITLTVTYTPYVKVGYLTDYLNSINFNSTRSYTSLVEAYNMILELLEEDSDVIELFELKVNEYNNLVNEVNDELDEVNNYIDKIFNGLLGVNLNLQLLSYALYVSFRRWF